MRRNFMRSLAFAAALISAPLSALAQVGVTYGKVEPTWFQQGKISGGISVTNSSARTALPAAGFVAWVCNTGSNDAYLAFGDVTVVGTVTGSSWLKAGTCGNYDLFPPFNAAKAGYVAALTGSSTTTLTIETGLGTGPQQLASSGGGSSSVTQGTSPWVDNISQIGGTNVDTNSGNKSAGTLRVVIATDQPSLPLPTGAATSANQTNGTQQSKVTDGTNIAAVKAASTTPATTDPALVMGIADGNNVAQGAIADAAVTTNATGSVSGKLRGLVAILADVWDSTNHWFRVLLSAGESHVGEVGGNILPITNAMTTSNATVATGQSIGGIQTLANAVRVSGSLGASGTSGIIQSVVLTFLDAVGSGPLDIYFYNATVTTGSNCQNATAFVLQTADRTNVLGVAHVTDFTSSNTAVVAQANNLAIPFGLASSTNLFACVVARASFAITGTSNASIKVNVLRN